MADPEIIAGETFLDGKVTLFGGDNRDVMRSQPDASVDSVVTDPPYALVSIVKRFGGANAAPAKGRVYTGAMAGFMGKQWDTGEVAFATEFWAECLRVLKPGGHVVAFSGTRTYHRLACAIEDSGFEIRDQLAWCYGSGFPKSHDVALDFETSLCDRIDDEWRYKDDGALMVRGQWRHPAAIEWDGWGTALKPAWEPICLARKPLDGTVAGNVLAHGAGALNIDSCRVEGGAVPVYVKRGEASNGVLGDGLNGSNRTGEMDARGRFPANILHDGSAEVVGMFPQTGAAPSGAKQTAKTGTSTLGDFSGRPGVIVCHDDAGGSAARFFYTAKADAHDRAGSKHPTVKPVDLMQWAVRLVTPPGGVTLDPFAGTGTTGEAAFREGMRAILIEREAEYQDDIRRRMRLALAGPDERRRESIKAKAPAVPFAAGSLFEGL